MNAAKTFEVPSHVEMDMRRPNGVVETVRHPTWRSMSAKTAEMVRKASKDAGRGDLIAWRNVTKLETYTMSAADLADAASERVQTYLNKTA